MALRLILGTSGQGKTRHVMEEVVRRSQEEETRQFYVIVPEQFSLEMQRSIVKQHPKHGFFNIDVLSFFRLAYRVFDECRYRPDDILEDLGVSMVLRKILSEHQDEFPFFKKSMKKAGFLDELKSMLMEFICYDVHQDQLDACSEQIQNHPVLREKCTELSKIFDYFEKSIDGKYMVMEQILDVLCRFVPDSHMLSDAVFYFDGFTGFTPIQLHFLEELLPRAAQINVTVTIPCDTCMTEELPDLFHFSKKTVRSLLLICKETGIPPESPVMLDQERAPRFQENVELGFLERHIFRGTPEVFEEKPKKIHVTVCSDPEQESEYILHQVEKMVRTEGFRYRDFAVITGDLAVYESAFERKAGILNIPLFVDTKKKMSYHPAVETLRALLYLVEKDYSYSSVFRYLKSGMTDLLDQEVDELENYVLAAGVRGYSMWKQPFRRRMKEKTEEETAQLEKLRIQFMEETEAFFVIWKDKKKTVQERMTALYEELCRLKYPQKLEAMADKAGESEDYVREKECREMFALFVELFEKIVAIFGEEYLAAGELAEIIDAGLDSLGLGVLPISMDQLILGDLKRTRLSDIKVLFLAGVNEGCLPPAVEERGILTDDEKEILKKGGITLANNQEERCLEDEFYMYLAFSRPSEELFFSYSALGRDGKSMRPSSVLQEVCGLYPALPVRYYPEEETRYYFNEEDSLESLMRVLVVCLENGSLDAVTKTSDRLLLGYWMSEEHRREKVFRILSERNRRGGKGPLSRELMTALFGTELRGSVTKLERYAACPYQYFCIYGMELSEREEYAVRPMDIGNLFHRALEYYSNCVKESVYSWKNIPEEASEKFMNEAVQAALDENVRDVLNSTARNQYKIHTVERILRRTVQVLRRHLKNSELEPDRFEMRFGKLQNLESTVIPLRHGNQMYLEGVIDRVDILEEEDTVLMRIIDYKSGVQEFDMNDLYYGLQMQLVIYMNAAKETYEKETKKEVIPAGLYYYHLKDPIIKAQNADESKQLREFRMSGYTNEEPTILEKIEQNETNFVSTSVRLTKAGTPYKNSPVLETADFSVLGKYVRQKAEGIGEQIYEGHMEAAPYRKDKSTACDYCPYLSVCGFDSSMDQSRYRTIEKQTAKEVLEEIRRQMD